MRSCRPSPNTLGDRWWSLSGVWFEFSGPSSEEQIQAAERELGVRFPKSYRTFLHQYGSGNLDGIEIFGLQADRLSGDVVMINQLTTDVPSHLIRFTNDIGNYSYYLDSSQMNEEGECPVIVFGPDENGRIVAESFIHFLEKREKLI
jgi:antitoxin YobK